MQLLNISETRHRANSKVCPLNNENWINRYWHQLQFQLYNNYGDINDILIMEVLHNKIHNMSKHKLKKLKNNLIIFYTMNKNVITTVRA